MARAVGKQLSARGSLKAHLRDELGLHETFPARQRARGKASGRGWPVTGERAWDTNGA